MFQRAKMKNRLIVEQVANFDMSEAYSKQLNKTKAPKNINQMWKKATNKGEVMLFKKGFLWNSWASYSMIAYRTHLIYFKEKYSAKPSGFIPLFK